MSGALVPLGSLVNIRDTAGPDLVQRYNMFTSVPIQVVNLPSLKVTGPKAWVMKACSTARLSLGEVVLNSLAVGP